MHSNKVNEAIDELNSLIWQHSENMCITGVEVLEDVKDKLKEALTNLEQLKIDIQEKIAWLCKNNGYNDSDITDELKNITQLFNTYFPR